MQTIPVLYSFARSGGTLVNQLLGVHPQCAVLSEVNPAASCKPVSDQAHEWLGLVDKDEAAALSHQPYGSQIARLNERAAQAGKRLVVRDWVTINFLPGTAGDLVAPSGELEQELYLTHEGLEPLPLVVTRRSDAVLHSIRRTFPHLSAVDDEQFGERYLAYVETVRSMPRVKLEDLRGKPHESLRAVLEAFQLDASNCDTLLERFHEYRNCTGNTTLAMANESSSARSILPLENSPAPGARAKALAEADRLFGYDG